MNDKLVAVAVILVMAGCGGGGESAPVDPASISSCEQVADASTEVLAETLQLIDELSATEASLVVAGGAYPEQFDGVQARGQQLVTRADELGCDPDEMTEMLAERAHRLSADTSLGRFILTSIQNGGDRFFGP